MIALDTNILIGVGSALFGGAGVKILEKLLARKSEQFLEAEKIRAELRDEIEFLKTEMEKLSAEVVLWRERYWTFYEEAAQLRTQLGAMTTQYEQLKDALAEAAAERAIFKEQISEAERERNNFKNILETSSEERLHLKDALIAASEELRSIKEKTKL